MTNEPLNTAQLAWASTINRRNHLIDALDLPGNAQDDIEKMIAANEEFLLDLAAPDFEGVILKLELLWEAQLHGFDQDSRRKRLIIEDLHRLTAN